MRRAPVLLCALVVVAGVLLGGCGNDDAPAKPVRTLEPKNTASSPSPEATASDSAACRLLTSKERASVAGTKLNAVAPVALRKGGRQCRWNKTLLSPYPSLEVVTSQAQSWVENQLPRAIDSAIVSGRPSKKLVKRLQAARKEVAQGVDDLSDREACDLFSLVVRASGGEKNAKQVVVFLPAQDGQIIATVQKCTQGVYTTLTYQENSLTPSEPLRDAMLRLVDVAQARAIRLWG